MHKFVRSLITEWRMLELPFADAAIVVAVSGGADSLSLMSALHDLVRREKLDVDLVVAHFNHKLRGRESDADEAFVREFAATLDMKFVSGRSEGVHKGNVEQNARDERYQFLLSVAREYDASFVLTAHTINDQAETFLLNLVRGSGPDGLAGMRPIRNLDDDQIKLVRPLVSWATRTDTEGYCRERGIGFRHDPMNDDESFTRVRIRKTVIPMLSEINPRIVETLAQTAELMSHAGLALPALSDDVLELKQLRTLAKADLYRELRAWLGRMRGSLRGVQLKHIEAIEHLISTRKSGKTAEIPGGGRVVKEAGRLVFRNIKVE